MKTPQAVAILILVTATLGIAIRCGYVPYPRQDIEEIQSCVNCVDAAPDYEEDWGSCARFDAIQTWWQEQLPTLPDAEFSPYCTVARGGAHYDVDSATICLTDASELQEDGTLTNVVLGATSAMLDEAVAIVIAHEYGHHVTRTTLIPRYGKIDAKDEENLSDCFSGAYLADTEFSSFRVWVLGFTFIRRIGDDVAGIHGRGAERQKWYRTGVRGGYEACVASFWELP